MSSINRALKRAFRVQCVLATCKASGGECTIFDARIPYTMLRSALKNGGGSMRAINELYRRKCGFA